MEQLSSKMVISGVDFDFMASVEITSSYNQLTDIASIVIPRKINFTDKNGRPVQNIAKGESAVFKRGDDVSIAMGYNHETIERFKGVLSGVKNKYPIELSAEDEMYKLKSTTLTFSVENPQLSDFLKKVIPSDIKYEVTAEQNLGDFRVNNATPAAVLNELREKHGVFSFFRDGILYVGLAIVPKLQKTVRFTMFQDIIDFSGLQYINDFDRKIKVVAKSIQSDNTELTATVGDADGETRTLYYTNITSLKDLETKAKANIEGLKYSGFEGEFLTFVTPKVNHGDIVEIINPQIEEQSGGYTVQQIVTYCGMGGGRQKINIKQKVYDLEKSGNSYVKKNIAS
jgi:hypothetical protein